MESSFARQLTEENHTFNLENTRRILPKENYGQRLNKLEIYLSSENGKSGNLQ